MAKRTATTPPRNPSNVIKKATFLAALRTDGHVSRAIEACGAARSTVYGWRRDDKKFADDWTECENYALDNLEKEATRRAFEGTLEPVIWKGAQAVDLGGKPLMLRKYSDTLLIFMLKAKEPLKYCDRARTAALLRQWTRDDKAAGLDTGDTTAGEAALALLAAITGDKAAKAIPKKYDA